MPPKCFHCNDYYGSTHGQPVCSTCHLFLYAEESSPEAGNIHDNNIIKDGDSENKKHQEVLNNAIVYLSSMTSSLLIDSNNKLSAGDRASMQVPHFKLPYEQDKNSSKLNQPFENKSKENLVEDSESLDKFAPHTDDLRTANKCLTDSKDEDCSKLALNITDIPIEVQLMIFEKLDDLSVLLCGQVCSLWNELVRHHLNMKWKVYTNRRWPLFSPLFCVSDWHKVFMFLMVSVPCHLCFRQGPHDNMLARTSVTWQKNRIITELRALQTDSTEGIAACPLDGISNHLQATIEGPAESPYQGGTFFLSIRLPPSYPLGPPQVRFTTKIYHPNVSRHGEVGIDCIHHKWSVALTIPKILISIQSLLTDPYTKVCMEPKIGHLYDHNRNLFDHIAEAWTSQYAMHNRRLSHTFHVNHI